MEIGEPTLLAKLPRAGTSEEGLRKFSQVYGIRDGKTKKRNEVCAAIDGNSLNIFEVVNGRNIVSWPIPPDAAFVSPPYSERQFVNSTTFVRRCWCAVRRKGQTTLNYYEQTKAGGSVTSSTSSYPLENLGSIVIKVESINAGERQVVITQDDGSISCLSVEGGSGPQSFQLASGSATPKIHAAQSLSLIEARVAVLKGRPDIVATLTTDSIITCAIYNADHDSSNSPKGLSLGIWILPTSAPTKFKTFLQPVITFDLQTNAEGVPNFKSNGSRLEIRTPASVDTFDLTTAAPQKLYERKPFSSNETSYIELSHHLNMSFSSGEVRLYNPDFNSLLASTRIINAPLKRKRDGSGLARMSFIAYFSQLRRVVAFSGSQLLAIDVLLKDVGQNPFKQSSLLIGNILKGRTTEMSTVQAVPDLRVDQQLSELSQELDDLIRTQNVSGFERRLKESFNLCQWEDLKRLNFAQKRFIISKMFALTTEDRESKSDLTLKFLPTQLLGWCIKSGILDAHTISKALRGDHDLPMSAISSCFQEADIELNLLEEYIVNAPYIDPAALTSTIQILIDQALQKSEVSASHDMVIDTGIDLYVDNTAAAQDSKHTSAAAEMSHSHATNCLIHALRRFACAGSATISDQIRRTFEQKEILALIQFLRQQLFLGGYTRLAEVRSYPSPPPSQVDSEDALSGAKVKIGLNSIVVLLNGCIDSLGIVGIIGSNGDQAFIERMIPELCSEIESATTAVEDSAFLQGLVRETLRYTESVEREPFEVRGKVEKLNDTRSKKGKIATLYAEGDAADVVSQVPTVLPLSLKAEEDLSKKKVRKGGQAQKRSAREMGMLKDRLKAPYAFERLVL